MRKNFDGRVRNEIRTLRHSLKEVDRSLRRLAPMLSAAVSMNDAPKANGRSRRHFSVKARASMVLQGRYMGFMRQLRPRQKAQVRKIRATKGVTAAIQRAREMTRS